MSFFSDLFRRKETSAQVAKERLLTVLVHDRVKLTPEALESFKTDLAELIQRYFPSVQPSEIEVSLLREHTSDRLKADIPLRRALD
ncbi:MAG: cell division topological specificity factor MinE [Chloroflexaceae bacterium]|nr:cell division topological specificity factor MinE [Chloroflexaceae bacterium]NJO05467.1 cell division topological specificity factor MinE [Chloroflexaceae bacterium]